MTSALFQPVGCAAVIHLGEQSRVFVYHSLIGACGNHFAICVLPHWVCVTVVCVRVSLLCVCVCVTVVCVCHCRVCVCHCHVCVNVVCVSLSCVSLSHWLAQFCPSNRNTISHNK